MRAKLERAFTGTMIGWIVSVFLSIFGYYVCMLIGHKNIGIKYFIAQGLVVTAIVCVHLGLIQFKENDRTTRKIFNILTLGLIAIFLVMAAIYLFKHPIQNVVLGS
jgi:hypothetical protein